MEVQTINGKKLETLITEHTPTISLKSPLQYDPSSKELKLELLFNNKSLEVGFYVVIYPSTTGKWKEYLYITSYIQNIPNITPQVGTTRQLFSDAATIIKTVSENFPSLFTIEDDYQKDVGSETPIPWLDFIRKNLAPLVSKILDEKPFEKEKSREVNATFYWDMTDRLIKG